MSSANFVCKVKKCDNYNKILYGEFIFHRRHLWRHSYNELRTTAFEIGLIQTEHELVQKDWLVRNLVKASLVKEALA